LRYPGLLLVSAVAGDPAEGVVVTTDLSGRPSLQNICTEGSTGQGVIPAVRIHSLVSGFNEPDELESWAFGSLCEERFGDLMAGMGTRIRERLIDIY